MMPQVKLGELQVVNIWKDEGIWAVLDEGCNRSMHGTEWGKNARKKLADMGFASPWSSREQCMYSGVGGRSKSLGKRDVPYCLKMHPSEIQVPGIIRSDEVEGDVPMLLSTTAQAELGFVKDMRNGWLTMLDWEGQYIEVRRTHDTGLLAIEIGHLMTHLDEMPEDVFATAGRAVDTLEAQGSIYKNGCFINFTPFWA